MTDYKNWLGILAVVIGFGGYVPYFTDIFKGNTKPHIFSWFIWGIIESIIFAIQINQHAGAGAWVTGFTVLICFTVAALSVKRGIKEFARIDWFLLGGALISILLWVFTKNPLGSVILLIITDAVAFSITFRKTYKYPFSETLVGFFCSGLKALVAIFALQNYSPNNWLFFAYLVIANNAFWIMAYLRRRKLSMQ